MTLSSGIILSKFESTLFKSSLVNSGLTKSRLFSGKKSINCLTFEKQAFSSSQEI